MAHRRTVKRKATRPPATIKKMRLLGGSPTNSSYTIEDMQKYAKKHKATCLSPKYYGYRGSKLKWECKNGHLFSSSFENLKRRIRKGFCPTCNQADPSIVKKRPLNTILINTILATTTSSKWKTFIIKTVNKSAIPIKIMDIYNLALRHFNITATPDKVRAYRNIQKYISTMILYDELKRVKKIGRDIFVTVP